MTPPSVSERESKVRVLHANLNPQQAKGLRLIDAERTQLLERLHQLAAEIENAYTYEGALA